MRNRFGVDSDGKGGGEELRGVEGGKTVFRLCCMRKESMINKKEKINSDDIFTYMSLKCLSIVRSFLLARVSWKHCLPLLPK